MYSIPVDRGCRTKKKKRFDYIILGIASCGKLVLNEKALEAWPRALVAHTAGLGSPIRGVQLTASPG